MSTFDAMSSHPAAVKLRVSEAAKYNEDYFRQHYWREDLPGLSGNRGLSYDDPDHTKRFQFLFDTIVVPHQPQSYLDAGAAQGHLLRRALEGGMDAYGIDISPLGKEFFDRTCEKTGNKRFLVAPITCIPFRDAHFDLVVCLDVLEHLVVFDIFDAVSELARVTCKTLVCSINLDNPYQFHPSILSRETWIALFESTDRVRYDQVASSSLNNVIKSHFSEYDLFVFRVL